METNEVESALAQLLEGEKKALIESHSRELRIAKEINVIKGGPGEPITVGFVFSHNQFAAARIHCSLDMVYSVERVNPHWC